jgi:hypothetical protein
MIYSDEDKLDAGGHRVEPFFKPDWSPEYMLAVMYTSYSACIDEDLSRRSEGFAPDSKAAGTTTWRCGSARRPSGYFGFRV